MTEETTVDTVEEETTDVINDEQIDVSKLQETLEKQQVLIDKLRKIEKKNQEIAKSAGAENLKEALLNIQKGATSDALKYKELYENVNTEYKSLKEALDRTSKQDLIKSSLNEFNVKDVNTTIKLVDINSVKFNEDGSLDNESLKETVEKLKKTDPILFNEIDVPSVKSPSGGADQSSYENAIMAATSQKELMDIMKKYNKI